MRSQNVIMLLGVGAMFVLLAGCGASTPAAGSSGASSSAGPSTPDGMPPCPFELPGTTVSEQETPDGLVVEFVNAGRVDEVRKRMRARAGFAKAHPRPMPAQMTRELEDTPNGIRMTVHSTDPAKVDVVRKMVRDQIKQAQRQAAHS